LRRNFPQKRLNVSSSEAERRDSKALFDPSARDSGTAGRRKRLVYRGKRPNRPEGWNICVNYAISSVRASGFSAAQTNRRAVCCISGACPCLNLPLKALAVGRRPGTTGKERQTSNVPRINDLVVCGVGRPTA
jgi:hypothetical protein